MVYRIQKDKRVEIDSNENLESSSINATENLRNRFDNHQLPPQNERVP